MHKLRCDLSTGESKSGDKVGKGQLHRRRGLTPLWALSIGWEIVVPMGSGALIGHVLDQRHGTGVVVTIALLLVGVAVGYYNVARLIRLAIACDRRQAHANGDGAP
jgi:F0F1-type ATP synthase assembly protein I